MEEERVMGTRILDEPFHGVEHLLLGRPRSIASAVVDKKEDVFRLEPVVFFRGNEYTFATQTPKSTALIMKSLICNASFAHPFSAFFCPT